MASRSPRDYAESVEADHVSQRSVHSHAEGASIVQVETVGKGLLIIIVAMLSVALIAAIASIFWAASSASSAAMAAARADIAERRANIAEVYAKQVYVELNRLGYPVQTPAEEHSVAPAEAYQEAQ